MKHTFVRCVICDTPYADEKEPFLCERCQANGMAAEAIKRLNTETDNAAAHIAALQSALAEARGIIRRTKDFADYIGRDVPVFVGGEAELSEAAARWLEKHGK
jgi:hydroxypyruvate isomerase